MTARWRLAAAAVTVGAVAAGCVAPHADAPSRSSRGARSSAPSFAGKVVSVADGDTITVKADGQRRRVRLLGIDAPEVAHQGSQAQCGADAARAELTRIVEGRRVTVATDPAADATDRYGRILGYVDAGGVDVAAQLVVAGLAGVWHPKGEPDPSRGRAYAALESKAQAQRVGSWGACDGLGRGGRASP